MSVSRHIVCFNPYTRWSLHSARETTLLHALHQRGWGTTMVVCDGLMTECDMYQPAKGPSYVRDAMSCGKCQAGTAKTLNMFGQPFYWLSRWLDPSAESDAQDWASRIANVDLLSAEYDGLPLGSLVHSSVVSHFRVNALDMSDADVIAVFREYLASAHVIAEGMANLLESEQPDVLLLFNGRMAPTRVALEIAKRRGIRTVTEERGFAPGFMRLVENTHCLDPEPFLSLWRTWQDTPLTKMELEDVRDLLSAHRQGTGFEMPLFAAPAVGAAQLTAALGLHTGNPVVAVFTSSIDESSTESAARGLFADQSQWLTQTMEIAQTRPHLTFVVRAHPNTSGKRALGANAADAALIQTLAKRAPENVIIVQPEDDISSFDLMDIATAGIIWHSTVGLEMAAMGKPVTRVGSYWFSGAGFMHAPETHEAYAAAIDHMTSPAAKASSLDRAVNAWRMAACWFFRQSLPFPFVSQPDWAHGAHAYESPASLAPGKDGLLDYICTVVAGDSPLHLDPDPRPAEALDAERQFIAEALRL